MRPLRLEIEGFASFRERTEIDFEGVDLFVLSGPMGAGKSSIIDAIGFALYGSIVRYDNANLVAPLISQGLNQARVRLDFTIGPDTYSAVRVVQRSARGQVNTEGRLEREGDVVAGAAKDVTEEVTRVLGLTFQQFTKCVVLPQGEFADLLHAKPADRQDLLVRLLDLGLYRNIGSRARDRHSRADARTKELQGRLENDLRNATEAEYKRAESRLGRLEALANELSADDDALDYLRTKASEARATAKAAEDRVAVLAVIALPPGTSDLDARLQSAREALEAAQVEDDDALAALEKARDARALLPERAAVGAVIDARREMGRQQESLATAESQLVTAEAMVAAALEKLEGAQAAVLEAEGVYDGLRHADAAYFASEGLKVGDICPICGETLNEAPRAVAPKGLERAKRVADEARKTLNNAIQTAERARLDHGRREQAVEFARDRLNQSAANLVDKPSIEECEAKLRQVDEAEQELRKANERCNVARSELSRAKLLLEEVDGEGQGMWTRFREARDIIVKSGAGAPVPADSIEMAWRDLVACAATAAETATREAEEALTAEAGAVEQEGAILRLQAEKCAEAGVIVDGSAPRDAANAARGRASEEFRQIDDKLAERQSIEVELTACLESRRVAGTLEQHLQRNRFERWYLQEALTRLVHGATQRLLDLSNQQYSLVMSSNATDFLVIDHTNFDEQRPVRTLSGGETFLASLALALALGDEIAGLAANGVARLDALFLDEGFGTLDENTLETVATTIEELGSRGRMVGIVTHVKDLADRLPVQYQVRKEGRSSRVTRVDAS